MHTLPAKLITPDDFEHYWENIAESSIYIRHNPAVESERRYFDDIDKLSGIMIQGIVLLVVPRPIHYIDNNSDNIHQVPVYDFSALKAIGTDKSVLNATLQECRQAHNAILSKLKKDSEPNSSGRLFSYFKWNEVITDIIDVPILSEGYVGYSSLVPMGSPNHFNYNPAEWR